MRRMRGIMDAALVTLLWKPLARRVIAMTRRRVADRAHASFIDPAQALMHTALPLHPLPDSDVDAMAVVDAADERAGRAVFRPLVLAGAVIVVAVGSALVIAAVIRSRRGVPGEASAIPARELVAVPVVATERDELRSIRGIGPVTADLLRGLGVTSVEQIAAWSPDDVGRIAERVDLPVERIEEEDWVGQAQAVVGEPVAAYER